MERKTRVVKVGNLKIGGNNPIIIQSMTNTNSADVEATVRQINELEKAGCQLVRMTINNIKAAEAIKEIKKRVNLPLVADIHFDYRLALLAIENGIDKLRINPGNIGSDENVKKVVEAAKEKNIPIRIGVNSGSIEKEILKKYNAHATFYIVGSHVEGNESIIKQIVAEGHELGNHSYSHPLLPKKSADEVYKEVHNTSDLIAKASGGLRPMSLRPPYGGFDKMVAEQAGIAIVNWSIDSLDWKYRDAAKTIEHIKENAHNGGILLMHDIHEESVEALPTIIEYLQAEGYELVTVDELMAGQPLKPNHAYFNRVDIQKID